MIRKFETSSSESPAHRGEGGDRFQSETACVGCETGHKTGTAEALEGFRAANAAKATEADSTGNRMPDAPASTTLVVSPNLSMSWRANLMLVAALAFICLGLGLVWAWFGLWLVLPFAGAEVLFVTWCLYLTVRRLSVKEVITISESDIWLEWGMKGPEKSVRLPRQWSRLVYECSENPFEVGDLLLRVYGKEYVLGQSLGRDEKRELYGELNKLIRA